MDSIAQPRFDWRSILHRLAQRQRMAMSTQQYGVGNAVVDSGAQVYGAGQGAATVSWWLSGGISAANVAGVWQPKSAASLDASYLRLDGDQGYADIDPAVVGGVAPTWSAALGWILNGTTQHLYTGILPQSGMSFIVAFTGGTTGIRIICSSYKGTTNSVELWPATDGVYTDNVLYMNGTGNCHIAPRILAGTLAVTTKPYRNGIPEYSTGTMAAWSGGANDIPMVLGARNNNGTIGFYFLGNVTHFAAYKTTITDAQILAVSNEIVPTISYSNDAIFFGDSITVGLAASSVAQRYVTLVCSSKGWTSIYNAGLGNTPLQNTVQNTVATIGGAVVNNFRDEATEHTYMHYPKAHPTNVVILYGLNDLRLNDAALTAANFQNDLAETIDILTGLGTSAGNIIIGSPPYIPEASYALNAPWNGGSRIKHAAYTAACAAVATAKGTKYADVYQYMTDNGGDTLVSVDGIHPNDAGHAAIATAFLSVL